MPPKKIGLFFEHIDREYMSLKALADSLANTYSYHTEIYSSVYQQLEAYNSHKQQPFDLIALPYIYGLRSLYPYYLLFKDIKNQPRVVNLQYEQIAGPFNVHRLMPDSEEVKKACYYFCWNESYKAMLLDNGVCYANTVGVPNLRFVFYPEDTTTHQRTCVAHRFDLDPAKMWILYAESGTEIFNDRTVKLMLSRGYLESDLLLRNKKIKQAFDATLYDLGSLDSNFFDKFELIYRAHPGKVPDKRLQSNSNIHFITDLNMSEWCQLVDVVVSRLSTSLFEAERFGKQVFRYDPVNHPSRLLTYGLELYPKIENFREIEEGVKLSLKPQTKVYPEYIGVSDPEALNDLLERFVDVINKQSTPIFIPRYHGLLHIVKRQIKKIVIAFYIATSNLSIWKYCPTLVAYSRDFRSSEMI